MADPGPPVIGELLRDGVRLEIWCTAPGCRRHLYWDPADAVAVLGERTPFVVARSRLYCTACAERDGVRRPGEYVTARAAIEDVYANLRAAGHMG